MIETGDHRVDPPATRPPEPVGLTGLPAVPSVRSTVRRGVPRAKLPAFPAILFTDDAPPRRVPLEVGAALPEVSARSGSGSAPSLPKAGPGHPGGGGGTGLTPPRIPVGATTPAMPAAPRPAGSIQATPAVPPTPIPSGSIWVVVRDPWTLVAHWSFRNLELVGWAARWGAGEWRLRVHDGMVAGQLRGERRIEVTGNHCFLPVATPGGTFVVELGYATTHGKWHGLALTLPVTTEGELVHFPRTGPPSMPDARPETAPWRPAEVAPAPVASRESEAAPGPARLAPSGAALPGPTIRARELTALVTEAADELTGEASSAALAERTRLVRSRVEELESPTPDSFPGAEGSGRVPGPVDLPSSPAEVPAPPPGFWLEVNAEVILYGRTERDAQVTIGDRPVRLREDGSFSFRFALPDGDFPLPVVAVNAAGTDRRAASVRFTRATVLTGEVGVHPQDPALRPPRPEFAA